MAKVRLSCLNLEKSSRSSLVWVLSSWSVGTTTGWTVTAWMVTTTAMAVWAVTLLATDSVLLLSHLLKPLSLLGEWGWDVLGLEIWGEELVGVGNSIIAGLNEVLGGTGHILGQHAS